MSDINWFPLILLFGLFAFLLGRQILSFFNISYWTSGSTPDPDAQICDVSRKQVKYAKNDAKYKTTVDFTDGFRYVTHATDREQGFLSYRISMSRELDSQIRDAAVIRHDKAVRRKLGKDAVRTREARPEVEEAERKYEELLKWARRQDEIAAAEKRAEQEQLRARMVTAGGDNEVLNTFLQEARNCAKIADVAKVWSYCPAETVPAEIAKEIGELLSKKEQLERLYGASDRRTRELLDALTEIIEK